MTITLNKLRIGICTEYNIIARLKTEMALSCNRTRDLAIHFLPNHETLSQAIVQALTLTVKEKSIQQIFETVLPIDHNTKKYTVDEMFLAVQNS